ncbi:hypothetical protein pPM01_0037 [Proteus phage pPM_01]|uniref:Uncharacterized protein n=1 Tax=Proteus phage pPM_01 TaxID=1567485 RepID=A0A0B4SK03_9CAUD|nr:hypothetical protein AVV65_gp37 [Proteus phage pPM_01]AJA41286.1 hypothetical protein pPM01_0037 [Proteus phage pPM_01]
MYLSEKLFTAPPHDDEDWNGRGLPANFFPGNLNLFRPGLVGQGTMEKPTGAV